MQGRDMIGRARTGTGKTLAFALPIISKLEPSRERARLPRAIVIAPTRELAKQVADEFSKSGVGLTTVTVYGARTRGASRRTRHHRSHRHSGGKPAPDHAGPRHDRPRPHRDRQDPG
ncbi:hypothetical protein CTI14_47095, partial [Methylobacterium radiotolerans]